MDEIINTERDKQQSKIRVAAYCRVVENQDEPMKAREIQRRYYIERIKENSKWELVDIFIDMIIRRLKQKLIGRLNLIE